MGNQQAITYSTPIGEKQEGESQIYRHPQFKDKFLDNFSGQKTVQGVFLQSVQRYPNHRLLGSQVQTGENSKHYVYKTYAQCLKIAEELGSGIINLNLIPREVQYKEQKLRMIGVFSKNKEEWLLLDYANVLYGNTMIPLYDTLGIDTIPYILEQTQISTLFLTAQSLETMLKVKELHKLEHVVSFDALSEDLVKKAQDRNLKVFTFQEVLQKGRQEIAKYAEVTPTDIFTFSYTSGTTGMPKGVMLKHENFVSVGAGVIFQGFNMVPTDVYLSYLPLPHVLERIIVTTLMGYGACICIYGGDVQKIKDDITLVRPTVFASVPRLFRRLALAIKDKLDKLEGYKKTIAQQAIASKLYHVKNSGAVTHKLWDNLVFNQTKNAFGGRIRLMISGSAPIAADIADFLKIAVCAPLVEGYGQTEGCGGSFVSKSDDPVTGHVGGCLPNIEFKLLDVPEMKYLSTDRDEQNRPTPRGEILIRGLGVFAEYYHDEEKTKETLDKDGWLHSGDIGVVQPNGSLKIVDRRKNIFKLSQGEYIAPEKVEDVYLKVKGVAEVFVYGDSSKSFCVAIVVPDKGYVMELAQTLNLQGTFEELCLNNQVVKHYLGQLTAKGKELKLNGMENVKNLYLEHAPLMNYGLMSNTLKLMRHNAKDHFKPQIDAMYLGQE